jgi:PhzF family phenazine biosynthesis protein
MEFKIYQIDAFAEQVFGGNPAAVVPLTEWLTDDLMQKIAMENNLSETAFYIKESDRVLIRWFTPGIEVDLCGHATLASAHVLFEHEGFEGDQISFFSPRSGELSVSRSSDGFLQLDFPKDELEKIELAPWLSAPFQPVPLEAYKGKSDIILIFDNEQQIKTLHYDLHKISQIRSRGVIVTAPGDEVDFVSRFFGPLVGVPEDPVTGSAHTSLTPLWAEKLGKNKLFAHQVSHRGGKLVCELAGNRVKISGKAITYLMGTFFL